MAPGAGGGGSFSSPCKKQNGRKSSALAATAAATPAPIKCQNQQPTTATNDDDDDVESPVVNKSLTSIGFVSVGGSLTAPKSLAITGHGGGGGGGSGGHAEDATAAAVNDPHHQQDDSSQDSGQQLVHLEAENHDIPKDVLCYIIVCPAHQTLAVQQIINSYYFPSVQMDHIGQHSISDMSASIIEMLIENNERYLTKEDFDYRLHLDLVGVYRVKVPKLERFITNLTFRTYFQLSAGSNINSNARLEKRKPCICRHSSKTNLVKQKSKEKQSEITWIPIKAIPFEPIWGGELLEHFGHGRRPYEPTFNRITMVELDDDYVDDVFANRIPPNTIEDLQVAVNYLFNEFVVQCFPAQTMAKSSFFYMCDKITGQITMDVKERMFRSLDREQRNYLDFADLLNGLILFEMQNTGVPVRDHLDYIFRYYDTDGRERLRYEQFSQLMRDFFAANQDDGNASETQIDTRLIDRMWTHAFPDAAAGVRASEDRMSYDLFVETFFRLDDTYTSAMRFPMPRFQMFDKILEHFNCRTRGTAPAQQLTDDSIYFGPCEMCQQQEPVINPFTLSASLIWLSAGSIVLHQKLKQKPGESGAATFRPEILENNIFCLANEFLIRIEKMNHLVNYRGGGGNFANNYFFEDENLMLHHIQLLLEFTIRLMENQSPIIQLRGPGYVFGDLSGSIMDLICFRRRTFRSFPFFNPTFLVFLGNLTGSRSDSHSNLTCLIYLMCMKILAPSRVVLLRGPNEVRQTIWAFRKELSDQPICDEIARLIYRVLSLLPLACVVDEQIFLSNFVPPPPRLSVFQLQCAAHWAMARIATTNIDRLFYTVPVLPNMRRDFPYRIFDPDLIPLYEWTIEDLLSPPSSAASNSSDPNDLEMEEKRIREECRQLKMFLTRNRMSLLITSISAWTYHNISGPSLPEDSQQKSPEGFVFGPGCHLVKLDSSRNTTTHPACAFIDRNRVRFIVYEAK